MSIKSKCYFCECCEEILSVDYSKEDKEVYFTKFEYAGEVSAFRIMKNKLYYAFKQLFGKKDYGIHSILLDVEDTKRLLNDLISMTGYKPKDRNLSIECTDDCFGCFFYADDDKVLDVAVEKEEKLFVFTMLYSDLFYGYSKWKRIKQILSTGYLSTGFVTLDKENAQMLIDYLSYCVKKLTKSK